MQYAESMGDLAGDLLLHKYATTAFSLLASAPNP